MLAPEHLADLQRSGLTDATIEALGFTTLRPGDIATTAHAELKGVESAYTIPYPGLNGFHRLRLFPPVKDAKGHTRKYHQPHGSSSRLYVPPATHEALTDVVAGILITEGEKKAAKADQDGLPCLGIGGCWNWRDASTKALLPDFDQWAWRGRPVTLVVDSDAATNPDILDGFYALGKALEAAEAIVSLLVLPLVNKLKAGLDDYLVAKSRPAFDALLATEAKPLLSARWRLAAGRWKERESRLALSNAVQPLGNFLVEKLDAPADLIAPGLLPSRALIALVGPAKTGKTWLAMQLGLCVAGASRIWFLPQYKIPVPARVLYLNLEVARHAFQSRLQTVVQEMARGGAAVQHALRNFLTLTLRGDIRLDEPDGVRRLMTILREHQPDLCILDPLARLHHRNENDPGDMTRLANCLIETVQKSATSILIVHHAGKGHPDGQEEIHYGRGHSAFGDAVDSQLNLRGIGGAGVGRRYRLSFVLRHAREPEPLLLKRDEGSVLWTAEEETKTVISWVLRTLMDRGRMLVEELDRLAAEDGVCTERKCRSVRYHRLVRQATTTERNGFQGKYTIGMKDSTSPDVVSALVFGAQPDKKGPVSLDEDGSPIFEPDSEE